MARDGLPAVPHFCELRSLHALNAALAAGRPLLVCGDPGTGKSQLARAAADLLGRKFVWKVVDAQTQVSDLFYTFDAVERLALAQVAAVLYKEQTASQLQELLHECNFVRPGPLWWAFDPGKAREQAGRYEARGQDKQKKEKPDPERGPATGPEPGYVVLIDEIDKTDPSVPNGLLEALGQGTFEVPKGRVSLHSEDKDKRPPPLLVITTNEERELPNAFVRRCMVLNLRLPEPEDGLEDWLVKRGVTHHPALEASSTEPEGLLRRAASLVIRDRKAAKAKGVLAPGQAEYLDLLRAVTGLRIGEPAQGELLETVAEFALKKHPSLQLRKNTGEQRGR